MSEYAELKRVVEARGLLARQHHYYFLKFGVNIALLVLGVLGLQLAASDPLWWLADVVFLSFVFVQIALMGHDILHLQFVRAGRLNTVIGLILGNLLVGVSRAWWNDNHTAHHAHPNDLGADPNVNILLLGCTPEQALSRPGWVQWIIRHQVSLLVPIFCLEFFSMRQQSIDYALHRREGCARGEGWLLAGHFVLYGGVLVSTLGVGGALAFAFVHHLLTGLYMASIFAPNHKGMPLHTSREAPGFLRQQVLTARNVRGSWWVDLVYGGLNYQIEHHLFPSMSRNNLRQARPLVRAFCEAHGVNYCETSVVDSWREILSHFGGVSRVLSVRGEPALAPD
jgi:fatty acid desaturase